MKEIKKYSYLHASKSQTSKQVESVTVRFTYINIGFSQCLKIEFPLHSKNAKTFPLSEKEFIYFTKRI